MNLENSSKTTDAARVRAIERMRRDAKHGEFFFAQYTAIGQNNREAPVFVLGSKDHEDIIICSCTKYPPRTDFDIPVQLKIQTSVRTNKVYTIKRDQLAFRIPQKATPEEYKIIMDKVQSAIQP